MKLSIPKYFDTKRLDLFRLRYEDAEEIFYTYASKPEATRFMSWPTHRTMDDTRAFLRYAVSGWHAGKDYSFAIRLKRHGRLIGSIGILYDDGKIQFGYVISPTHWGQGYATEACRKLMEIVRAQPDVKQVSTFVDAQNTASIKVLLKSGLVQEAKLENWFRFVNQDDQAKDCLFFRLPL